MTHTCPLFDSTQCSLLAPVRPQKPRRRKKLVIPTQSPVRKRSSLISDNEMSFIDEMMRVDN